MCMLSYRKGTTFLIEKVFYYTEQSVQGFTFCVFGSTDILMPMLLLTFNFRTVSPLLFLVRRLAHS